VKEKASRGLDFPTPTLKYYNLGFEGADG